MSNEFFKRSRVVLIAVTCSLAVNSSPIGAATSFQQGVNDYNAGKYALALSELQPYEAAYPNYPLVHYYIALCHQGLNHLEQAKTEYSWVVEHGDPSLKAMAQAGFSRLANAHTSIASTAPAALIASAQRPGASRPSLGTAKIKKVIEFYADW